MYGSVYLLIYKLAVLEVEVAKEELGRLLRLLIARRNQAVLGVEFTTRTVISTIITQDAAYAFTGKGRI